MLIRFKMTHGLYPLELLIIFVYIILTRYIENNFMRFYKHFIFII
jgi:hypothetical protein